MAEVLGRLRAAEVAEAAEMTWYFCYVTLMTSVGRPVIASSSTGSSVVFTFLHNRFPAVKMAPMLSGSEALGGGCSSSPSGIKPGELIRILETVIHDPTKGARADRHTDPAATEWKSYPRKIQSVLLSSGSSARNFSSSNRLMHAAFSMLKS
jgi:hypothetical protein